MSIFPGFGLKQNMGPEDNFTISGKSLTDNEKHLYAHRKGDETGNLRLLGTLNKSGGDRVINARQKGAENLSNGIAKVRPEALQNKADKKSSKPKVFNASIPSAGITKRSRASIAPKGGQVASLLKSKANTKKEDKLG